MILNSKSLMRLSDVHSDLALVIAEAAYSWHDTKMTWQITDGRRTLEQQRMLYAARKTRTLKSRHLTGHAVDFVVLLEDHVDWTLRNYAKVADHIKATAKKLKIPIEWGGDWIQFKDGPHIQLTWKAYQ